MLWSFLFLGVMSSHCRCCSSLESSTCIGVVRSFLFRRSIFPLSVACSCVPVSCFCVPVPVFFEETDAAEEETFTVGRPVRGEAFRLTLLPASCLLAYYTKVMTPQIILDIIQDIKRGGCECLFSACICHDSERWKSLPQSIFSFLLC